MYMGDKVHEAVGDRHQVLDEATLGTYETLDWPNNIRQSGPVHNGVVHARRR